MFTPHNAARVVNVRLRRNMQLNKGKTPAELIHNAPVLHDKRISSKQPRALYKCTQRLNFAGTNLNIYGHIHVHAKQVCIFACLLKFFVRKIIGTAAGIKIAAQCTINGIRARIQRSVKRSRRAGWRKELQRIGRMSGSMVLLRGSSCHGCVSALLVLIRVLSVVLGLSMRIRIISCSFMFRRIYAQVIKPKRI